MELDCIAFANVTGKTLLTRAAHLSRTRMVDEARALETLLSEKIYVLRSFNDRLGNEVGVEIVIPAALAVAGTADWARVEYWRPTAPRPFMPKFIEGQVFSRADYTLAGILITPADDAVRHAYDYTESPFHRWNPNLVDGTSPAAQVGDIFVVASAAHPAPVAFGVAGTGFTQVSLSA